MLLPIDNLLERVSAAVRTLPGAVELYVYGSASDPHTKDPYSDLDLQVRTETYPLSRAAWPMIFHTVGEIELAYPLHEQLYESAFCLGFAQESLYHKVDIGLSDQNQPGFLDKIEKKVLLWRQAPRLEPVPVLDSPATQPEPGTALHFLVGELIGSVRYAKARKRAQHLACWRFLSAKVNALLSCDRWDGDLSYFPASVLTTWDFTALDRSLPETQRLKLLEGIRIDSPPAMDETLLYLTRQIVERICPEYALQETSSAQLINKYLSFLEQEIGWCERNPI